MSAPLIYLASPFSDPDLAVRKARYKAACVAADAMMKEGLLVFSPIAHGFAITQVCGSPGDWKHWREFSLAMIAKCDELHVLMLEGWRESVGVTAEIEFAKRLNLPVIPRRPETLK